MIGDKELTANLEDLAVLHPDTWDAGAVLTVTGTKWIDWGYYFSRIIFGYVFKTENPYRGQN